MFEMWYSCTFVFITASIIMYVLQQLFDTGPNKVKFYYSYIIFTFCACLTAIVVIPYCLLKPGNGKAFTGLMKDVDKLLNLKYQIRDIKFLSEDGGAVIVANHQSILDTFAVSHIHGKLKCNITFVMKKEVFYWWPFGILAYLAGTIFIDRNNPKKAYHLLQATKDQMLNKKNKLWLFPEGTRNNDYTKLLPFKKGAFSIAVEAQVPIMPIVISPYYFINNEKYTFGKGFVVVQCLEPIPTKGLTIKDVPELIEKVHDRMTVVYKNLFKEIVSL